MNDELKNYCTLIMQAWCKETAHPSYQNKWSKENRACGQCAVTALAINDICEDMQIYKCKIGRTTHYYNQSKDGKILDLTFMQFGGGIEYGYGVPVSRRNLLKVAHVKERYRLLKSKMGQIAIGDVNVAV
jgi:hypothetical protein